jgi:uncharacterized protein (DUF433 family)
MATTTQINTEKGFKPTIEGTRITVQQVAEYHRIRGWDAEAIARAFRLAPAQVYAALAYYYDHQAEIDAAITSDSETAQQLPSLWDVFSENALAQVMTAQEVAEEYPISVNAVYQAIRRKKLEARQSGKTWLILRRDAEKLWGFRQ